MAGKPWPEAAWAAAFAAESVAVRGVAGPPPAVEAGDRPTPHDVEQGSSWEVVGAGPC